MEAAIEESGHAPQSLQTYIQADEEIIYAFEVKGH